MTYKATLARIKAGIVRNYQDAPEGDEYGADGL